MNRIKGLRAQYIYQNGKHLAPVVCFALTYGQLGQSKMHSTFNLGQIGFECTTAKEQTRAYCSNTYTVPERHVTHRYLCRVFQSYQPSSYCFLEPEIIKKIYISLLWSNISGKTAYQFLKFPLTREIDKQKSQATLHNFNS